MINEITFDKLLISVMLDLTVVFTSMLSVISLVDLEEKQTCEKKVYS